MKVSRKVFVGRAAAAFAAVAAGGSRADAQLVYRHSDWKFAEFDRLVHSRARVKQVFDATAINEGRFLNNIKNSLNGLQFGFEIPAAQLQIIAALHGPANTVNFNDSAWEKYHFGEVFKVTDPATGKPTVRNPFYASKAGAELHYPSQDPNHEDSPYQDRSMQGLQARGVKFLSCHSANEEFARLLIHQLKLSVEPDDLVKDLESRSYPGVLVVPSMVAAIALLQADGHYAYTGV